MIQLIEFVAGFLINIFFYSNVFLPLFYSLPRSVWLVLKGRLRPAALLSHFVAPVIWMVIGSAAYVVIALLSPAFFNNVLYGPAYSLGALVALIALFVYCLTPKGRKSLRSEYDAVTYRRFNQAAKNAEATIMPDPLTHPDDYTEEMIIKTLEKINIR